MSFIFTMKIFNVFFQATYQGNWFPTLSAYITPIWIIRLHNKCYVTNTTCKVPSFPWIQNLFSIQIRNPLFQHYTNVVEMLAVSVTRFLKHFVCLNLFIITCNTNISNIIVELFNSTITNHFSELSEIWNFSWLQKIIDLFGHGSKIGSYLTF